MTAKAYEYALNLLSARAYSVRDLERKLSRKDFDPDEIAAAIDRLVTARLLDDARFAREYARQKLTTGGSSARRVQQDLIRKGISAEHNRSAIDEVMEQEDVDVSKSIDAAARKKVASMGNLADDVKRRRLFGFLARRGFDLSEIRRAVDENVPTR